MPRKNRWRAAVIVAIAGLAAWACGPGAMNMIGDAAVDAGSMLMDAGSAIADAGGGTATAQSMILSCDQEHLQELINGTSFSRVKTFYKEVTVPLDVAAARPRVWLCNREVIGTPAAPVCPEGWTCSGLGGLEQLDCYEANATFNATTFRVVCGSSVETDTIPLNGYRYNAVRVLIQ